MKSVRRVLLIPLLVVATISLAYALGVLASDQIIKYRAERLEAEFSEKKAEINRALLEKMGTIEIGDRLENFRLENISGDSVNLYDLFLDRTLLIYMEPFCNACDIELMHLKEVLGTHDVGGRTIIISPAELEVLQDAIEGLPSSCVVLRDNEYIFASTLQIQALPFNMLLNKSGDIVQVFLNALNSEEIKELLL